MGTGIAVKVGIAAVSITVGAVAGVIAVAAITLQAINTHT